MKYEDLCNELSRRLKKMNYYERVAVECKEDDTILYLNEAEIRVLQIMAHEACLENGIEAYRNFVSQFVVHSGRTIADPPMEWREDSPGKFKEPFKPGFFNVNDNLAILLSDFLDNY